MTMHVTARLAWHNEGWNGHICKEPLKNTYCVGAHSYPGDMIAERRNLEWEKTVAGKPCSKIEGIPPCIYSINAFGKDKMRAFADPPTFFNPGTQRREWDLPPATVCIWPYEEMYREEVHGQHGLDNDLRRKYAKEFFSKIEPAVSLVFYYANYSNPLSTDEAPHYVLVGLSKVRGKVGDLMYYEGCNEETKRKFGGGYVWDYNLTSYYPDQGLRLPYHIYKDDPRLESFAIFPENPVQCKYGSKLLTDDQALGLVEQFLRSVCVLQEMGDISEDWSVRRSWLEGLIDDLWKRRGVFPGLPVVCQYLKFTQAIPYFKEESGKGNERGAAKIIWDVVDGKAEALGAQAVQPAVLKTVRRQWQLLTNSKGLLKDVLPRFDLTTDEINRIMSSTHAEYGLRSEHEEIATNPYLLVEQYVGDSVDEHISWSQIDRGAIPSPELGVERLVSDDSPLRLRALVHECLQRVSGHTFLDTDELTRRANQRLAIIPEWKRVEFLKQYFEVDADEYNPALCMVVKDGKTFVYRREIYEDERYIESELKNLLNRPQLRLRRPMSAENWRDFLFDRNSVLAQKTLKEYEVAIQKQVESCQSIFIQPFSVLCGPAGTGKTTVLRSIVNAIRKVDGEASSVITLAPTGKAADRAREIFAIDPGLNATVETATIHSFLAKRGWLNENMTFKTLGGQEETARQTIIIDECSMLDLQLLSALFRAIKWSTVKRLILVGDPNQLPPIGVGRVFADIVGYCRKHASHAIAELTANLRQLENMASGKGTAIIRLASLYRTYGLADFKDEEAELDIEEFFQKVQEGGDIDQDLRVVYWNEPEALSSLLINQLTSDMADDAGVDAASISFYELMKEAFNWRPEYSQILSPYRGELYGIEALNQVVQKKKNEGFDRTQYLDGISLFDKVIQIRNRTTSDPIYGYNPTTGQLEQVDVFNGELGFSTFHGFDLNKYRSPYFRLKRFAVSFARNQN